MKKVLLVLAFVTVYGVSMSMSSTNIVAVDNAQVTVVANMDDNNTVAPEGEKDKEKAEKTKKAEAKVEAKSKSCSEKVSAKDKCLEGKAEAKKDCGSACEGKK
ncbi:MAG: hypothetical protein L3J11_12055 [Draconibacterium sp.]|nr:hypothetical protein [Draconibacterium sp.]